MTLSSSQKFKSHIFFLKKKYSLYGIKSEFEIEDGNQGAISLLENTTLEFNKPKDLNNFNSLISKYFKRITK